MSSLPQKGGPVLAAATVQGGPPRPVKTLQFSGYQWEIRRMTPDGNFYDPANAWTDQVDSSISASLSTRTVD